MVGKLLISAFQSFFQIENLLNIKEVMIKNMFVYVSLQLSMQNVVSAQPCVGKLGLSLILLNFLGCNFTLWFKTP